MIEDRLFILDLDKILSANELRNVNSIAFEALAATP